MQRVRFLLGWPYAVLGSVVMAFTLFGAIVLDPTLFLGHDESVYLLEARQFGHSRWWGAHRALGMPLLLMFIDALAPDSLVLLRRFLLGLVAALIFVAYVPWIRLFKVAPLVSAAVTAFSWPILLYASTALPNLIAGLMTVGIAGMCFHRWQEQDGSYTIGLALLGGGLVLVRPAEAALVTLVLGVFVLVAAPPGGDHVSRKIWRVARPTGPLLVGFAAGSLVWVIESFARFGGPAARLRRIFNVVESPTVLDIAKGYLASLDGGGAASGVSPLDLLLAALVVTGLTAPWVPGVANTNERKAAGLQAVLGLGLLLPFLRYAYLDVRLLLPAWCVLALSLGSGYAALARLTPRTARLGPAVLMVGVMAWSAHLGVREFDSRVTRAEAVRTLTVLTSEMVESDECVFASERFGPQVEVVTGCVGMRTVWPHSTLPEFFTEHSSDPSVEAFALLLRPPGTGTALDNWPSDEVEVAGTTWFLYGPYRNDLEREIEQ